jgi:FkbM family methyltransferase
MISNKLIWMRHITPRIRGKGFIFRCIDRYFGPFPAEVEGGFKIPVYSSSLQDKILLSSDSHLAAGHPLHQILTSLKEGEVFLDIGANIGLFSLIASRKVGNSGLVIAIEPSRREFVRLLTSIEWNNAANIIPFKIAASDKQGFEKLSIATEHSGRNSFSLENCGDHRAKFEVVPSLPIDRLIDCCASGKEVAACKIDVEGFEMKVLSGMSMLLRKKKIRTLCVEIDLGLLSNANSSKTEIYNFMQNFGYTPTVLSLDQHFDEVFIRKVS